MIRLCLVALTSAALMGEPAVAAAPAPAPPGFPPVPTDPTKIPPMPTGKQVHCTAKVRGPKWVAGPGHGETQGWTVYGYNYEVIAWGVSCGHARAMLQTFFPKMPAFPMGTLRGGPKGYRCHAIAAPGTRSITNLHDGWCSRLNPSASFSWEATGPAYPGPYVVLH